MSITSARAKYLHRNINFLLQTPHVKNRFEALAGALEKHSAEESHYDHCAKMILRNQWKLYEYKDYAPLLRTIIGHTSRAMRVKIISHFAHSGTLRDIDAITKAFGYEVTAGERMEIVVKNPTPELLRNTQKRLDAS